VTEPPTEIEISDDSTEPREPAGPQHDGGGAAPYRNLLVPLVVVPALIVMVLVLVFVLFGLIVGEEATPRENLDRMLHGGANEREQAAFNLVRQFLADWEAESRSEPGEWGIDASMLPELREAWGESSEIRRPRDVKIPLVLAILMGELGDPDGVRHLAELTRLSADLDPEGEYRFRAAVALGTLGLGDALETRERETAAAALVELLASEDEGLRSAATMALQAFPGPRAEEALVGMLASASLELRNNAALSLARMGSPAGAEVLAEMVSRAPYEREHERDPTKWANAERISESRRKALEALVSLGRVPERIELQRLAEHDPDAAVRELARRLLERSE
jgi:HEAT repeat protein